MIFTIIKDLAVKIELHKRLVRTLSGIRLRHISRKRGRFEVYPINAGAWVDYYRDLHLDRKFLTEVINTFLERIHDCLYERNHRIYRNKKKRPIESWFNRSFYSLIDGLQNNYFAMLTALVSLITVTFTDLDKSSLFEFFVKFQR
jgi:hypothetical protein